MEEVSNVKADIDTKDVPTVSVKRAPTVQDIISEGKDSIELGRGGKQ